MKRGSLSNKDAARVAPYKLLEHPTRVLIYNSVKEEPVASVADLQRRIGIPHQTLWWHINAMLKGGLLRCRRYGKFMSLEAL